jgi:hypothetical protein
MKNDGSKRRLIGGECKIALKGPPAKREENGVGVGEEIMGKWEKVKEHGYCFCNKLLISL